MSIVLITGATRGIGRETARQLAALGHTVYGGARDLDRDRAGLADIGVDAVTFDVTDDASAERALRDVAERSDGLDVLINNAGVWDGEIGVEGITGSAALAAFDTNVVGMIRATQAALPLLRRSANPVIVNVSSALGSFAAMTDPASHQFQAPPMIVYGTTKAAVSMLTLQYSHALPEFRVNAVEPGFTATDFTAGVPGGRPVIESAAVVVRWATIGPDGPTGTFQQDSGPLGW